MNVCTCKIIYEDRNNTGDMVLVRYNDGDCLFHVMPPIPDLWPDDLLDPIEVDDEEGR